MHPNSPLLPVGSIAPDFELPDQNGTPVRLYDLAQKKWVVLFFYPRDHSPICTSQACAFRNAYQELLLYGADVLGISPDSADSHQRFGLKHSLPFRLLSDTDNAVRGRFGVPKTWGLIPGRATFVVDTRNTVRMAYASQFTAGAHMKKALSLLEQAQREARFSSQD